MKANMPLSKPIRELVNHAEAILDTEISLVRNPDVPPNGTLVDIYSYNLEKNIILFPAHYIGLLKDFTIARHCLHLLIKGAAAEKKRYLVCSFTEDSLHAGLYQIYLDALKDESKKDKKLPVEKLLKMLLILYTRFHNDINTLPWNPITNAGIYFRMPYLRKTQLYYLMKEGKADMDDMMEFEDVIPRRYFVLDKSMFYARDLFLAQTLPADALTPVVNIPQMKKFNHLEVKEMLTTRWTHTAWYQSKVFGDAMLTIMQKHLSVNWQAQPDLDYYWNLYQAGVNLTDNLIAYMTMKNWFVWEEPRHMRNAQEKIDVYEHTALKRIFGDLILDE